MQESRIKWQCRRGMRELDELLLRYVERRLGEAGRDEKAAFEALLALPDPEIAAYLLRNLEPESAAIARVVRQILLLHPT